MKKGIVITICSVLGILLFFLCYDYADSSAPKEFYNVYLDGELLGVVNKKEEVEEYINKSTEHLINVLEQTTEYCPYEEKNLKNATNVEYYIVDKVECAKVTTKVGTDVDNVYNPEGLKIEKILSYNGKITPISEIYEKMVKIKSFTVKGYQFTIRDGENVKYINTIDKDIFELATKELIKTYAGEENYEAYLNGSQEKIKTTGTYIENIYIDEDISVKEKQIPITEKIYTDYKELSQYLLFSDETTTTKYKVKENEMIDDIALANEISVQEFLISNSKYKNASSLIAAGTEVNIKETNPQLKVVVESYVVEDKTNEYKTIYQYDDKQYLGYEQKTQTGQDGLERISQTTQTVNGLVVYVEPKGKEVLKPSVDEIIIKGEKFVPNVGELGNWLWPSESGWTITDNYTWRIHPFSGQRQFHTGIDIAGTGYGSKIFAANNGTIVTRERHYSYGNYIVIDHNNGYYTLYAHMSKFADAKVGDVVSRGQVIGYVGSTGSSTGPHIHFEAWKDCKFCRISPWTLYK